MDQNLMIRMAFAAVGVCLILFAVMKRQLLSGRHVVDLIADKLGLALKVDAFGLIVLVGFVMIGSQIFLWYKGYEDQLSTLRQRVGGYEASIAELAAKFKEHELSLSLVFTGHDYPNIKTMTWPPTAYVQREGERKPNPYDLADFIRGPGGVVASFKKLRQGDRLSVVVDDGGKRWASLDMVAPSAQLEMTQVEKPQ
jgi:hypothetical protein